MENQNIINLKNNNSQVFICPICQEVLDSEKDWINHMKTHISDVKEDTELKEIANMLNDNFSDCQIKIKNDIKTNCKYNITLITKENTKINLRYKVPNELRGGNPTYPNSINELISDINYILDTINIIKNDINKQGKLYDFKCLEYYSYTNILENKFAFQFKLNPKDENYITEVYNPSEEDIHVFLDMLNKYIVTELQGDVYIDNIDNGGWGDTFYIDNIDIENLMKRAMNEGKQVLLKII